MGINCNIYQQEFSTDVKTGRNQLILTELATTYNNELINKLESIGQDNWYVSSECGAIWEVEGSDLIPFADELKINKKELFEDDWYRICLNY